VIFPAAGEVSETVGAVLSSATVKVNPVVCTTVPAVPVTVIGYTPAGVAVVVLIVMLLVQVGIQDAGVKEAEAPEGNPEAVNVTAGVPPTPVTKKLSPV